MFDQLGKEHKACQEREAREHGGRRCTCAVSSGLWLSALASRCFEGSTSTTVLARGRRRGPEGHSQLFSESTRSCIIWLANILNQYRYFFES